MIPEPVTFNGGDPGPAPWEYREELDEEFVRERDWFDLEVEARTFLKKYGAAALLRCVANALRERSFPKRVDVGPDVPGGGAA